MRHQKEQYAASLDNESGQHAKELSEEGIKMLKEIGFLNKTMNPEVKEKLKKDEEKVEAGQTLIAMFDIKKNK